MRNVDPLGAAIGVGAVAPVALERRRRVRFARPVGCRRRRRCSWEPLRRPAARSCAPPRRRSSPCRRRRTACAAGESRCSCLPPGRRRRRTTRRHARSQLGSPLVERLLGAAQDVLQLRAVHFDNLRRGSHPATTGRKSSPAASVGPALISSGHQWTKDRRSGARAVCSGPVKSADPPDASRAPRRSRRVAGREQHRQLMGGQPLGAAVGGRGPPAETALREPLVAEPKTLAVVDQHLQRRRVAIAKDEHDAGERILLQALPGRAAPGRRSLCENRPARRPPGSSSAA